MFCIHHDELLGAVAKVVAIPEARIVLEPMWIDAGLINATLRASDPPTPLLRRRTGRRRLGGGGLASVGEEGLTRGRLADGLYWSGFRQGHANQQQRDPSGSWAE